MTVVNVAPNLDATLPILLNDFFTFDFNIQGIEVGDIYALTDTATNTGATHTVAIGDTVQSVTTSLYNQIALLKTNQTDPWLWFDWSQVTNDIGPCIRSYGNDGFRFKATVTLASAGNYPRSTGGQFTTNQLAGETLFTWDGIGSGNFTEIEWTVYKDATPGISPAYYFKVRGAIGTYGTYPITLPYIGDYNVEMKLFDVYNSISSSVKTSAICVDEREVIFGMIMELYGIYLSNRLLLGMMRVQVYMNH